jgi:hypothetical protein
MVFAPKALNLEAATKQMFQHILFILIRRQNNMDKSFLVK